MHPTKTMLASLCLWLAPAALAQAANTDPFKCIIGFGAAYAPVYEGSNKSRTLAFPQFNVSFQNDTYFAGTQGIGFRAINTQALTLSLAVGYGGERKVKDDRANLAGMGDIKGQALAIVSAEYRMGMVSLGADLTHGSRYGTTAKVSLATGYEVLDGLSLGGSLHATYADKSHMSRYFGVSAAQSAASGYAAYAPGSGLKSAGIDLQASYAVTDTASMTLGVAYERLQDTAARSGLVKKRDQRSAFVGLTTYF